MLKLQLRSWGEKLLHFCNIVFWISDISNLIWQNCEFFEKKLEFFRKFPWVFFSLEFFWARLFFEMSKKAWLPPTPPTMAWYLTLVWFMPKVCEDETLPRPPSSASQNNRIHIHPLDNTINLSVHQHLYPPGRMLHIVRQWTKATDKANQQQVWSITQLLWAFCSQGSYVSAVPNQVCWKERKWTISSPP